MAQTLVGVGDPKAVKRYSAFLAVDVGRESYFNRKFMGRGIEAQTPIQMLPHLENDAGDTISYDLVMQLKMQPVEGDTTLRGKEEDLKMYTDSVVIDMMRGGVNSGGRMTRKRTVHDLRKIGRTRQAEWWARVFDELFFMYISGARGVNTDFIFPTSYTGFAGNALKTPDSAHMLYGGDATSKATVGTNDYMTASLIERSVVQASVLGGGTSGIPAIEPIRINGEEHYVCVMHPFQEYSMRTDAGANNWLEFQKAAAGSEGRNSPIFKGALGMVNNCVLHSHKSAIRFSDYGAGSEPAARALFMGRQAAVVAFGSAGTGLRFDWTEETEDRGNQLVVTTASIFGIKKTAFDTQTTTGNVDFGVIALDTYADDPNS